MFFTASREDGKVHGWDTFDMLRDVTSHSRFTINTNSVVNSITTLQNAKYLCVAGRDLAESNTGKVEIYEMAKLGRDASMRVPGSTFKNPSAPNHKLPTHTAVV